MGKQRKRDKLYVTYKEWVEDYGGKKSSDKLAESKYRRLPFDHCCVSLQPFEIPCCDANGNIFDLHAIIIFLKKFKINPVTGKAMTIRDLRQLKMYKNREGEWHCPVLMKVFTNNTSIVVNLKNGNVFSHEAVEKLNFTPKNYRDLITDDPFERKDIVFLQNAQDLSKFNLANFHHVKLNLRIEDDEIDKNDLLRLKNINSVTHDVLDELERLFKQPETKPNEKPAAKADKFNTAHYSQGKVAASFTSTVIPVQTVNEAAILDENVVRYERVKKKGYVRLITNYGALNLELFCDLVPKTCENFMKHCQNGYYNNTIFHRSVRNFMIQGGDPTGNGRGGESIWGGKFADEFYPSLSHSGRGILSMANSGTNTNGSQFFITYRSCKQLDRKHSIFGKVVGGLDVLGKMEQIEVDEHDRPLEKIVINRAQVFVDPYDEVDEQLKKDRQDEQERIEREKEAKKVKKRIFDESNKPLHSGVGKYLQQSLTNKKSAEVIDTVFPNEPETTQLSNESRAAATKKRKIGPNFSNF